MDLLRHNVVADMPGPQFLLCYGILMVAVLMLCWRQTHLVEGETYKSDALPPIPLQPDPYAAAYLRGGNTEVARLVVFALMERGFLQMVQETRKTWQNPKPRQFERTDTFASTAQLPALEQCALAWFNQPRTVAEMFGSRGSLVSVLDDSCDAYERQIRREHLLTGPEAVIRAWRTGAWGALVLFGVSGYKLLDAYLEGRSNVGFLILMSFLSALLLALACRQDRLSARGQNYLRRMQLAFERLKPKQVARRAPVGTLGWTPSMTTSFDHSLMIVVALFGVAALNGTALAHYTQLFPQAAGDGGGGGGCGGSSGGCGGSSGGCGGGGCGGGCGGGGCGGG